MHKLQNPVLQLLTRLLRYTSSFLRRRLVLAQCRERSQRLVESGCPTITAPSAAHESSRASVHFALPGSWYYGLLASCRCMVSAGSEASNDIFAEPPCHACLSFFSLCPQLQPEAERSGRRWSSLDGLIRVCQSCQPSCSRNIQIGELPC